MEQSQHGADVEETGEQILCYSCDTPLPEGRRHCPGCGRSQLRTCYCGNNIPVTVMTCPHCGADWTQSARVRKRKSRSRQVRWPQLAGYALGGALVALLVAALLNMVVASLASGSLSPGETLPMGAGERMVLAAQTLLGVVTRTWEFLTTHGSTLLGFLLVLAAGAAAGALYYVIRITERNRDHSSRSQGKRRDPVRVKRRRA